MRRKLSVYLCGRMDYKEPYHAKWRRDITPFLKNLGLEVLDPYQFEPRQLQGLRPGRLPAGYKHWYDFRFSKEPHLLSRFMRYMGRIIKYDMSVVRNDTDFLIVYWDEGCRGGAGTQSEMSVAFDLGKPVYCVATAELPAWSRGCCEEVFANFEELKKFLEDEYGGETPSDVAKGTKSGAESGGTAATPGDASKSTAASSPLVPKDGSTKND